MSASRGLGGPSVPTGPGRGGGLGQDGRACGARRGLQDADRGVRAASRKGLRWGPGAGRLGEGRSGLCPPPRWSPRAERRLEGKTPVVDTRRHAGRHVHPPPSSGPPRPLFQEAPSFPHPRLPRASTPSPGRLCVRGAWGGKGDASLTCRLVSSPGSGGLNRLVTRQMASKWPGVGASVHPRSLQDQQLLEEEVLPRAACHPDTSGGALGSLCRQFQRRLPLRAVSLNLRAGPSWKRLESPKPGQQGLQAAARSAKNALGAVSQVRRATSTVPWLRLPWCQTAEASKGRREEATP